MPFKYSKKRATNQIKKHSKITNNKTNWRTFQISKNRSDNFTKCCDQNWDIKISQHWWKCSMFGSIWLSNQKMTKNSKFQRKSKLIITQFDPQTKSDWKLVNQKKKKSHQRLNDWIVSFWRFVLFCSFCFVLLFFVEISMYIGMRPILQTHTSTNIDKALFFNKKK